MLAILFLATWPLIYYWPVAIGHMIFIGGDIQVLFLPIVTELARALADWRLPLWTTSIEGGFPLFAAGQTGALYPPNLLLFWLPPAISLSLFVLFHKAWIGVGMYLFCRAWGMRASGALLTGLVLSLGGFITARVPHVTLVAVASWLPWLLLFQVKYWRAKMENRRTIGWFLLTCFSFAMQFFAGFPPIAFFNIATFILIGTLPLISGNKQASLTKLALTNAARLLPQYVLLTVLQIVVGMGLAAIQLLPTVELTSLSNRAQEVGTSFFTSFSLDPQYLTQFVAPFTSLGQPGLWTNLEFWGYVGVLPLFLALLAPLVRPDIRTWFLFGFALLTLALAMGQYTPLYQLLYYVPVLNKFRVPARFLFMFSFSAALLAGIGIEELRRRLGDSRLIGRGASALVAVFAILSLLIINLAYTQPSDFWSSVWRWLPAVLILLRVENLVLAGWQRIAPGVFVVMVLGLTLLDLSSFSAPFLTTIAEMTSPSELAAMPRTITAMDSTQPIYRVYAAKYPPVTRASYRAALLDNTALIYGKQAVNSNQNLDIQRNRDYIEQMSAAMRNLINIRYYLSPIEAVPSAYPLSDRSEPEMGLSLELLSDHPRIPPTRTTRVEMVSYTDQSSSLPDGFVAGELVLTKDTGEEIALPIRMGMEIADWAYDAAAASGQVKHNKPDGALSFPAYLGSIGHEFQGHKYVARFNLDHSPWTITGVSVRSNLPGVELNIESIILIDENEHSVSLASLLGQNDITLVFRSQTAALWENRDVLPRAFLVHQAEIADDQTALKRLRTPGFRPDQVVLLGDPTPDLVTSPVSAQANDMAVVSTYKPESVTVNVKTSAAGYLVLSDSWYPGWFASVDNRPAPVLRADYMFRAVPVMPGQHTVTFEYRPQSFLWGIVISGLSASICVIIAMASYFQRTAVA